MAPKGNLPTAWLGEITSLMGMIETDLKHSQFLQIVDYMSVFDGGESRLIVVANAAGLTGLPPVDIAQAKAPVDL